MYFVPVVRNEMNEGNRFVGVGVTAMPHGRRVVVKLWFQAPSATPLVPQRNAAYSNVAEPLPALFPSQATVWPDLNVIQRSVAQLSQR